MAESEELTLQIDYSSVPVTADLAGLAQRAEELTIEPTKSCPPKQEIGRSTPRQDISFDSSDENQAVTAGVKKRRRKRGRRNDGPLGGVNHSEVIVGDLIDLGTDTTNETAWSAQSAPRNKQSSLCSSEVHLNAQDLFSLSRVELPEDILNPAVTKPPEGPAYVINKTAPEKRTSPRRKSTNVTGINKTEILPCTSHKDSEEEEFVVNEVLNSLSSIITSKDVGLADSIIDAVKCVYSVKREQKTSKNIIDIINDSASTSYNGGETKIVSDAPVSESGQIVHGVSDNLVVGVLPKKHKPRSKKKTKTNIELVDSVVIEESAKVEGVNKLKKKRKDRLPPLQSWGCAQHSEQVGQLADASLPCTCVVSQTSTPRRSKTNNRQHQTPRTPKEDTTFDEYLVLPEVYAGIENKTLVKGVLRINQKNYKEAYINAPDKGTDILIEGLHDRNRALEGDEVVVRIKPAVEWKAQVSSSQRTAIFHFSPKEFTITQKLSFIVGVSFFAVVYAPHFQRLTKVCLRGQGTESSTACIPQVVFIILEVHPRVAIGNLKLMSDRNPNFALFSPRDSRIPRIRIPMGNCPKNFIKEPARYENVLFLAKITFWCDVRFALGKECIFTIDPLTARDLDDAVSCKELKNGNLEIGVHISDVTFFLEEGTPLDDVVSKKATSIYLVDNVYHMLPREMCMFCSLLPGVDKLAFSVIFEMTREGEVVSRTFARSVINSCVQLAYEHAQVMIEYPEKEWSVSELPEIKGGFQPSQLSKVVNHLHRIALKLRSKRFENGALRIDQTKLIFHLDPSNGAPVAFNTYINKESHRRVRLYILLVLLFIINARIYEYTKTATRNVNQIVPRMIEEFMLLANVTVATWIKERFPDIAFLRCHPSPIPHMMKEMKETLEHIGIHLDVTSAGSLQASLGRYSGDDPYTQARLIVLNTLCARPMAVSKLTTTGEIVSLLQRAKYFCASFASEALDFWHYALSVPLYTHYTSPIRRYADVMVHRLLAASLGYSDKPQWHNDFVQNGKLVIAGLENMDCRVVQAVERVGGAACASVEERYKGRLNISTLRLPLLVADISLIKYSISHKTKIFNCKQKLTDRFNTTIDVGLTTRSGGAEVIASNCNKQKFAAKRAGEQSTELYLAIYVGLHGPMVEEAVVVDVKDHSFDIIVCSMGCTQRIYTNKIEAKPAFQAQGKISSLVLHWPSTETEPNSVKQIVQIFSIVTVSLRRSESSLKIETQLLRPRDATMLEWKDEGSSGGEE
uniref:RNB domain-containing protein n=1 Tax=Timema tahoe TaxID=61484 RepID=A0A7R9IGL5_9NEOP|nr:unnamed protein product [Timema tahoe]